MDIRILQSIVSRNRAQIGHLEFAYTQNLRVAREVGKDDRKWFYDNAKNIRKEIAKLAAIQKEVKKQIQEEIAFARFDRDYQNLLNFLPD